MKSGSAYASVVLTQSIAEDAIPAVGAPIHLGFLINNTGSAVLTKLTVTDRVGGTAVTVSCPRLTAAMAANGLFPGMSVTCNGTYTVTTADASSAFLTSSASVSATTPWSTLVTSPAKDALVYSNGSSGTTPLLPTILTAPSNGPAMTIGTTDHSATGTAVIPWNVQGTDSSGAAVKCATTSNPWRSTGGASTPPGIKCVHDLQNLHVLSPTPTLRIPYVCKMGATGRWHDLQAVCRVVVKGAGVVEKTEDLRRCFLPDTITPATGGGYWVPYGDPWSSCTSTGYLVVSLRSTTATFTVTSQNYLDASYKDIYFYPGSSVTAYQDTVSEPLTVDVEPTGAYQVKAMLDRIVYSPPGAASSQTYSVSTGTQSQSDVSFGRSSTDSSSSSWNVGGSLTASLTIGKMDESGVEITASTSDSWQQNQDQVSTKASSEGSSVTVGYTVGIDLTAENPQQVSPTDPPWMSDLLSLVVSPQIAMWDLASCSYGVAGPVQVQDGTSTACAEPGATIQGRTVAAPLSDHGYQQVTVRDLMPCVAGTTTFALSNVPISMALTQEECRQFVSQDPFAASALGLYPTEPGQVHGQSVNPALMLGAPGAPQMPKSPITTPANNRISGNYSKTTEQAASFSTSSSMATTVTGTLTNQNSVSVTGAVKVGPVQGKVGVSVNWGATDSTGSTIQVDYSGSKTFTDSQTTTTVFTVLDPDTTTSTRLYWDSRFNTVMFQTPTVPAITGEAQSALVVMQPVSGSVTALPVDPIPFAISAGQQLRLPSGQVLQVPTRVPAGSTIIPVAQASLGAPLAIGAVVQMVGSVQLALDQVPYGPIEVIFCSDPPSPTSPALCEPGTDLQTGAGQATIQVKPPHPIGPTVHAVLRTQAGATPYPGFALPGAPGWPAAVPGNKLAKVSWTAPSLTGGLPVTSYVVTPMIGLTAQPSLTFPATSTTQTVSSLVNGTAYSFRIAAVTAAGVGPVTTTSTVTVGSPTAPTSPAVVPGNGTAAVSWSASSPNASPVTGYVITPMIGSAAQPSSAASGSARSLTVSGLVNGKTYTFRIAAVNASGTGPYISTSAVMVGTPTAPAFPAAKPGNGAAVVSWWASSPNASPVTGYVVTPVIGSTVQPSLTFPATPTTQTVSGLVNGKTYTFRIAAVNAIGTGPYSTTAAITVGAPGAPTSVTAASSTQVPGGIDVTWVAPPTNGSPITKYLVTPYLSSSAGWTGQAPIAVTGATSVTLPVGGPNGLMPSATYAFKVAAVNTAGVGPQSALSPSVPTILVGSEGPTTTVPSSSTSTTQQSSGGSATPAVAVSATPSYTG